MTQPDMSVPIAAMAVLSRATPLIEADVDSDLLGMNMDSGICYGMNATAALIWRKLETPMTFHALVEFLVQEFDVPRDRCATETASMLQELSGDGLLRIEVPGAL